MIDKELQQLLTPIITALGYELWGVERLPQGKRSFLVRVYIDNSLGITLEDCEQVSYQISGLLDVEDPIPGTYTLEVSSPGLDRPLFNLTQFQRFIGRILKIKLFRPLDSPSPRRHLTGTLQAIEENQVVILEEGLEYRIAYDNIDKARIVPEDIF